MGVTSGSVRSKRSGFTLIEVIVTLIVLSILITIGTVFLSSLADKTQGRTQAQILDRVATAESSFAAGFSSYTGWQGDLTPMIGNDITVSSDPSTSATDVSVAVSEDGYFSGALLANGVCYWILLAPASADGVRSSGSNSSTPCSASSQLPDGSSIRSFTSSAKP